MVNLIFPCGLSGYHVCHTPENRVREDRGRSLLDKCLGTIGSGIWRGWMEDGGVRLGYMRQVLAGWCVAYDHVCGA